MNFDILTGKTCLVTGGAGFIGKHLVERLLSLRAKVWVLDNFQRGEDTSRRLWKRCQHRWKQQYGQEAQLVEHHLIPCSEPYTWYITVTGQPYGHGKLPDYVFHLAADMGDIIHNQNHNYDMLVGNLQTNLGMALLLENFAEVARLRRVNPPVFVFSSTACCFPHDAPVPTPESAARVCNPEPTNFGYGLGKWAAEQLFQYLAREKDGNLKVRIARFFNAYGTHDLYLDKAHVVPALIHKAHTEDTLHVLGSGNQRRSFVNAPDLCTGLFCLATAKDEDFLGYNVEPDWNIVNIGTATDHSIIEVAETILNLMEQEMPIEVHPDKPEGYPVRLADITRLLHLSGGWYPEDNFTEVVDTMIQDYRERKEAGLLI
jgi:nucleoside-diphosphate-sugar epimerase